MMTEFKRRELLQEVIDRMLYCENYIEYLEELNKNFKVKNRVFNDGKILIKNKFDGRGQLVKY